MEWRELPARWRAKFESASRSARLRIIGAGAIATVMVVVAVAVVAARSESAVSPPGAGAASSGAEPPTAAARRSRASASSFDPVLGTTTPRSVVVSVAGAVVDPGVVTLPFGARVVDAISAAGGATHGADPNALDLAAKLVDGVRIYVPKVGEHANPAPSGGANGPADSGSSGSSPPPPSGPVDLNTATEAELEALPGIGPSLAQAIIATRQRLGGFHSVDELREVRGIGDHRLADLRPLVTV